MIMRDTVFCAIRPDADEDAITASIHDDGRRGRRSTCPATRCAPTRSSTTRSRSWDGNGRVAVFLEVKGTGDYLPDVRGQPRHHDRRGRPRRRADRAWRERAALSTTSATPGSGIDAAGRSGSPTRRCATAATRCRTSSPRRRCATTVHALDGAGRRGHRGHPRRRPRRLARSTTASPRDGRDRADRAPPPRRPTQAKIAVLLVPGIGTMEDLQRAHDAGARSPGSRPTAPRPTSSVQHFGPARELGMETVGFLMMATDLARGAGRGRRGSWSTRARSASYVVDSAGALVLDDGAGAGRRRSCAEIGDEAQVGFHGHQNLSLGVANSVLAYQNGRPADRRLRCARSARARATRPPRCSPRSSTTSASRPASTSRACSPPPRRSSRRSSPRWPVDGPHRDRAGLRGRLLVVPAARRAGGRALRRARPRDPRRGRRGAATSAARRT